MVGKSERQTNRITMTISKSSRKFTAKIGHLNHVQQ